MPHIADHITPNAKLLIVLPFPAIEDAKKQKHLTSKGGRQLLKMLATLGMSEDDISLVHIIPYYPKGGTLVSLNYAEVKVYTELLRRKILHLDPMCILALGELPMKTLTVADNISNYRGSVLRCKLCPNHKVLISYEPSKFFEFRKGWGALRKKNEYEYQYDFLRILDNLDSRELKRKQIDSHIEENLDVFRSQFLKEDYINHHESMLSFDIECIGTDLVSISFSSDVNSAYIMPLHNFTTRKFCEALRLINEILTSPVAKVAQNGNFDIFYLGYYYNVKVYNFAFDTLLAQHSLYSNTAKGLDFLASIYTDEPYWKDEGKQWKDKNINWQEFYEYNGKDSANTLEIALAQKPLLKARGVESIFQRSMALCYPIVSMELRGVLIDPATQKELLDEARLIYGKLEHLLNELLGFELNIRSPKQVKEFLYDTLKLPKRYKAGKPTADVEALESLIHLGGPAIKIIMLMRDYHKRTTFYNVKKAADGRVRTTFKIGGTETGRLSSSKSISGTGCLKPESQILTRNGWIDINLYNEKSEVLTWDKTTQMYFWETPKLVSFDFDGDLIKADSTKHKCSYTPEHKIPYFNSRKYKVLQSTAEELQKQNYSLCLSGKYIDGRINFPLIRLLAATQADGSMEDYNIRFAFKKERKIQRLIDLCTTLGVKYTEQIAPSGYRRFAINSKTSTIIKSMFRSVKKFDSWLLDFDLNTLTAFIDEIGYWDAHKRGKSYMYYSVHKQNVDWVNTIAHLVGRSSTISTLKNNTSKEFYGYNSKSNILYQANVKPNDVAYMKPEHHELETYKGKVYCLATSSGFFPCKTNDRIVITGNSNLQNQPKRSRKMYISDPGYIMINADYSKAESWIVAHLADDDKMIAALKGADFHTANASNILGIPVEEVGYKERQLGKKISHACNYSVTAFTFQKVMRKDGHDVSKAECQKLLDDYFITYPKVKAFQAAIRDQLSKDMTLTNIFGRKMTYFDYWGDPLFRSAYAYIPQGSVGDMTNQGLLNIYNNIPSVEILLQIHDAVLMQTRIENISTTLIDDIRNQMSFDITVRQHTFKIPVDIELGYNWLDMYLWEDFPQLALYQRRAIG